MASSTLARESSSNGEVKRQRTRRLLPAPRANPSLYIGAVAVTVIAVLAIFAQVIAPMSPTAQALELRFAPPAWSNEGTTEHLLGTDNFGRDIFTRLLYGAQISLTVGLVAVLIAGPIGITIGMLAGFHGGKTESVLMRMADSQQALPSVLLAILVVATLGANVRNLILVLALASWDVYARITFSSVRSLRERDYVLASRASGASSSRQMFRHILPNAMSPLIVISALQVARLVLLEAGLSFLGLGVPPPGASWGNMLADGRNFLLVAPWMAILPGLAISIAVLSVNLLGDGLRQWLDPRLRSV